MPDPCPPFDFLTPRQVAILTNGCGGKGGTLRPPQFMWGTDACSRHDYAYWIGGDESDRHAANVAFLENMKAEADQVANGKCWGFRWLYRHFFYGMADVYYEAVEKWGRDYFSYGVKKTADDLPPARP
jgi:hypothetical protein